MMALENRSTITSNASQPLEVGSPVIMSTEMWVHGPFRDCVRVEWGRFGLRARLRALADLAALDVGFYGLLHLWPPVFSEDQFLCLLDAWMSGRDMVVELGDDFASKRMLAWDVNASVVLQVSSFVRDSAFVSERGFDPLVP